MKSTTHHQLQPQSGHTFSAKEKDDETGYSYFGARYYDSELSVWLSVDPMADKYPSLSEYMYCAGNPVIAIDPDGRGFYVNHRGVKIGWDGKNNGRFEASLNFYC